MLPGDSEKFNVKNVTIQEIYDELPKAEFTLTEWSNWVETHPEYLTINEPQTSAVTLSLTRGIDNITEQVTPLTILQGKTKPFTVCCQSEKELP
jgi:hypothetical protein